MPDKSHVSMEQQVCVVCAQQFDTGAILLDTRLEHVPGHWGERQLRQSLEPKTVTGWGLCPACKAKAPPGDAETMKPGDAQRTGNIAHIKRAVWDKIFDIPAPPANCPCAFIPEGVIDMLVKMMEGASEH